MEETSELEWSLPAILESIQKPTLTASTRLMIQSDGTNLIEEEAKAQSTYLIAQVIGAWSETLTLTLKSFDPESGILLDSLNLPPVVFQLCFNLTQVCCDVIENLAC